MEKVYRNELPKEVVRLGDKIIINLNPKKITTEDGVLWEYDSIKLEYNTPQYVIDNIIAENKPDVLKRKERDKVIEDFKWRIERNSQEIELGVTPTDDKESLLFYIQYLRDITEEENFPDITIKTYEEFLDTYEPKVVRITARQARLWLAMNGLLSTVESILEGLEGTEGDLARIEWQHAGVIERNNPLLSLLETLGIDIDQAMLEASTL